MSTTPITTTATTSNGDLPPRPIIVGYSVQQSIISSKLLCPSYTNESQWQREIGRLIAPEMTVLNLIYNCDDNAKCSVLYNMIYEGYGDPRDDRIKNLVSERTTDLCFHDTSVIRLGKQ